MANKKRGNKKGVETCEPEMPPSSGSEIEAILDTGTIGTDGVCRPVLVNQMDEEILALTHEDAIRLHAFLGEAIKYLNEFKNRTFQ